MGNKHSAARMHATFSAKHGMMVGRLLFLFLANNNMVRADGAAVTRQWHTRTCNNTRTHNTGRLGETVSS